MKCVIFTEGGKNGGFGHVTRCLSLSQAFMERGIYTKLIINGDEAVENLLKGEEYILVDLIKKRREVKDLFRENDIVIVDSYLAEPDFYTEISEKVRKPVYIDYNMRFDYPEGIVLNGNIYAP